MPQHPETTPETGINIEMSVSLTPNIVAITNDSGTNVSGSVAIPIDTDQGGLGIFSLPIKPGEEVSHISAIEEAGRYADADTQRTEDDVHDAAQVVHFRGFMYGVASGAGIATAVAESVRDEPNPAIWVTSGLIGVASAVVGLRRWGTGERHPDIESRLRRYSAAVDTATRFRVVRHWLASNDDQADS